MSCDLHLAFDAQLADIQSVFSRQCLISQPVRSPTDEIGGEEDEALLQEDGWFRADFDMVQIEDLFAFFDPSFDGLPAIVLS